MILSLVHRCVGRDQEASEKIQLSAVFGIVWNSVMVADAAAFSSILLNMTGRLLQDKRSSLAATVRSFFAQLSADQFDLQLRVTS